MQAFKAMRESLLGILAELGFSPEDFKAEVEFVVTDGKDGITVMVKYILDCIGEDSSQKLSQVKEHLNNSLDIISDNGPFIFYSGPSSFITPLELEEGKALIYVMHYTVSYALLGDFSRPRNKFRRKITRISIFKTIWGHVALGVCKIAGWPAVRIEIEPVNPVEQYPLYYETLLEFLGISADELQFTEGCFWRNI
ncbi:hypothetical protein ACFL24_01380 [Patescibacteria group bacterium]